ncbi:MAG: PadR family transcriptional regulator [Candidatus Woesearchaeota archaeon]
MEILEFKGLLSFLILHELKYRSLNGVFLAEKIGKRRGSKLTPGTIYPALKKLRNKKLVSVSVKGREKYYKLTKKGESELNNQYKLFSRYFIGLKKYITRK